VYDWDYQMRLAQREVITSWANRFFNWSKEIRPPWGPNYNDLDRNLVLIAEQNNSKNSCLGPKLVLSKYQTNLNIGWPS